jgi:dTDP-4-dehydrorhamnose 3,5-epimerase-like enzyme
MRDEDIVVEELKIGGADEEERRIFSPKGEMAQVLNRPGEAFRHLVYWDLDTPRTGQERGHHLHPVKTDRLYVLRGELLFVVEDPSTRERRVLRAGAGTRITIAPGMAHAFRSTSYCQVLEYSPTAFDPADSRPYRLEGW